MKKRCGSARIPTTSPCACRASAPPATRRGTTSRAARTTRSSRAGPRAGAQGMSGEDARAALAGACGEAGEEELARSALQRRLRGGARADEREKRRLLRELTAKGHKPSVAAWVLGLEWEGDDD